MSNCSPETPYSLALKSALKMLGLKSYSEREMREKLKMKGCAEEIIDGVINYLTEKNYLNDFNLCDNLFNKLSQGGKYGYRLVADKLRERKLPPDIIAAQMKEYNFDDEVSHAVTLARKHFDHKEKTPAAVQKTARYLTSRGFSMSSVITAVKELEQEK